MILSVVVRVQGGHFTDFSVAGVTDISLVHGAGDALRIPGRNAPHKINEFLLSMLVT